MEWIEHIPDIIQAAAQSTLGLVALVVIALTFVAFVFFKNAGIKIRVTIFFALLLGAASFISAMIMEWKKDDPSPHPSKLISFNTGWVYLGVFDFEEKEWKGKRYMELANGQSPTRDGLPNFEYGDTVIVRNQERNVIIKDYKTKGLKKQDICPVKDKMNASDKVTLQDSDYTGIKLPINHELEVREVCFGIIPDKPDQAIWLKVADN